MGEEKNEKEPEIMHLSTEKHPKNDQAENKKLKKQNKTLKTWLLVLSIAVFLIGWLLGSLIPLPNTTGLRSLLSTAGKADSSEKINVVMNLMENSWFFADSIDDLDTRLTDQALKGITTNDEDLHTEYMSADEITQFTQSINRNFVGIGVQFTNSNGIPLVTKVIRNSPAESAGVQAGDIIYSVDGTKVEGMTSDEIVALVQGEENTKVTMVFKRGDDLVTMEITRAEVSNTIDGKITDEGYGYLQILQFGEGTADELKSYLDEFEENSVTSLIIDLRDDGGGYLDALKGVLSYYLPENTLILQREYSDGTVVKTYTDQGQYTSFGPIVLLVNGNTASAAEAFTLAMKEQRDDVTIVGETTYGKGTVQITKYFDDGSALKYTDSKWMSPEGVWVNGTGIAPDEEVKLPEVLYTSYTAMDEGDSYALDSVSDYTKEAQMLLQYLGYDVDRTDGYFDESTQNAILKYQQDQDMEETGVLDKDLYEGLISAVVLDWQTNEDHDPQLARAKEILNG